MSTTKPTQVTTNEVRISYEHLLKPYANQPGAEEKYSVTILIPKSDIATRQRFDAAIQAAIAEGVTSKWNGARPPQPPVPIYDGDGVRPSGDAFGDECKGHWVMTASSKQQPEIVDVAGNPIFSPTEIYSGMYARVFVNFFAYNSAGKKGIGCGLGPVQKTRDGEPLGGRVSAADAFGGQQPQQPQYPVSTPPAAQFQQPAYPQAQPQYAPAPQQAQPQYAPVQQPAQPAYAPQAQPQYAPAPQQAQQALDPITGQPVGGIYGIN